MAVAVVVVAVMAATMVAVSTLVLNLAVVVIIEVMVVMVVMVVARGVTSSIVDWDRKIVDNIATVPSNTGHARICDERSLQPLGVQGAGRDKNVVGVLFLLQTHDSDSFQYWAVVEVQVTLLLSGPEVRAGLTFKRIICCWCCPG